MRCRFQRSELFFLTLALLLIGAVERPHRMPAVPDSDRGAPEAGWDVRHLDQLQALAEHVMMRTLRIEAMHAPEAPFDPSHAQMQDGAGVLVERGRLLTTSRYLEGASEVRVIRRDGRAVSARIERLDSDIGLATVLFEPDEVPNAAVLSGFASVPPPAEGGGASEIVVPVNFVGASTSIRIAAILHGDDATFLSGELANGVPAFDNRGRLVALADRPTPDRSRSVAFLAKQAKAWLEGG